MKILHGLALLPCLLLASCSSFFTDEVEQDVSVSDQSFYALEVEDLDGAPTSLADYRGQVSLVVNTASQCGLTPQYAGLEELQQTYGDQGFTVLAFPSGDFGGQEFDTPGEIREFCDSNYSVSFPLFAKSGVKEGDGQSEVFTYLGKATGSLPGWNFGKYLVGRDGTVIAYYEPRTKPTSDEVVSALQSALGEE